MRVHFALDSGAHSLFNLMVAGRKASTGKIRKGAIIKFNPSYAYYDTPEFKLYKEEYYDWLRQYNHLFDFSVMIDVIFNPVKTREMYKEMVAAGVNAIPAFHYGSDFSYLKWYMDRCPLIGVGGFKDDKKGAFGERTKQLFDYIGTNSAGEPNVNLHGFALTTTRTMQEFPFYSVDATTPGNHARFGNVLVPLMSKRKGKLVCDYIHYTAASVMSDRRSDHRNHLLHHIGGAWSSYLSEYIEEFGLTLTDLRDSFLAREIVNGMFYDRLVKQISEYRGLPLKIYRSGKYSMPPTQINLLMKALANLGIEDYYYFGSFFRMDGIRLFNKCFSYKPFPTLQTFRRERRHGLLLPPRQKFKPRFFIHPD